MRRAILGLLCVAIVAALPAPALAQTPNGQLAVVQRDRIAALNPDGSGLRLLYRPGGGEEITGPAWSPDGNQLAFIWQGKVAVLDASSRTPPILLTQPPPVERDADPAWSADGRTIGFRRIGPLVQRRMRVSLTGTEAPLDVMDVQVQAFAYAPGFARYAFTDGPFLYVSHPDGPPLVNGAAGGLAWSPDGKALAYVDGGSLYGAGLRVIWNVGPGQSNKALARPGASVPRWAPDGRALAYVDAGRVLTVSTQTETPTSTVVPGVAGATAVDWQPCGATTTTCRSVAPPSCATAAQVTTQTDQAVALPLVACDDPAAVPTAVGDGEHGTVANLLYTPRPGFVGQDTVTYRMTNGTAESDLVRVTIFVVPRAAAAAPQPQANVPPATLPAPYLSLRAKPRLDRKRRSTLARVVCDQRCSFTVRLEGKLRKSKRKRALKGKTVTRTLEAGRVVALRLKLPAKPKGKLKRVLITGKVRGGNGAARSVKLAVTVPR